MDDKLKAILEKVLSLSAEKSDGDGYKTDFELLEIQNMIRDYMALSSIG